MSPTGHLAIGFVAKKYAPQIPVLVLLVAAYAIDLIYFVFLALGLDQFEFDPWSHSLLMAIVWSVSAGLIASRFYKSSQSSIVLGLVVFSHWILDFLVWDNLPIHFSHSQRIGLGLYNKIGFSLTGLQINSGTVIATAMELGLLILGLAVYFLFLVKRRRISSERISSN